MKKLFIVMMIVFLLVVPMEANAITNDELLQIVSVIEKGDVEIDEWEMIYKEKVTKQRAMILLNELRNTYKVTSKQNENSVVYTIDDSHNDPNLHEEYSVVIPTREHAHVEVIAKLKGSLWNKTTEKEYVNWQSFVKKKMFTNNARTFACLTTAFSGIIDNDNVQKYVINELEIESVQAQVDNNENTTLEKIIYGYTNLWEQKITIDSIPMNFQMAVTTNELGEFQFIIGTPILINEY